MTLPADFGTGTVTATFVGIDGDPTVGSVTFTAVPTRLVSVGTDTIIVPEPIVVPLVDGVLTAVLPATDDEDISPVNFTYRVVENFTNGKTYFIDCPVGSTTDLSDVTPQDPSTGNTVIRVSDGDLTVIGGKDYTIPWMAGWNCPMLVPGIYDGRVFMVGCAVADITPTPPSVSEGELRIVVKVELAFTSAPSDPSESDIPTEWIVAQALESADIYGAVLIPLDNFADNGFPFGVPVWFRGSSIDGDGFTTKIVMFFPEGIPADPAEMTMVSFVNGEKRTDTIPAPPSENAEGEAVDLTTTMPALYDGTAAAVHYADVQDAKILQDAKTYADTHGGGGGDIEQAITDHVEAADPHGDRQYADEQIHSQVETALDQADVNMADYIAQEVIDRNAAITAAIDAVVAGAPGAFDTLLELSDALADDADAIAALITALAGKQATIGDGDLTIARTAGLQAALDLKLDASHASVTNSRAPNGAAGGILSGTYPNPSIADGALSIAKTSGLQTALDDKLLIATSLDQITAPAAALAMNAKKITGLANGTTSTDAAAYGQLTPPKWITLACATKPPNTYTTWTPTISAVSYGGYAAGATGVGGETWTFDLVMAAGTWSIRWVRRTTSTSGIITPTLGGTSLTTVDCYSASNAEASSTQTGITISTAGYISLILTNPTKNASSAGNGFIIHGIELWRTGP